MTACERHRTCLSTSRHRVRIWLLAALLLLAPSASARILTGRSAPGSAARAAASCPAMKLFAVRGSGQQWNDHQGYGEPLWSVYRALQREAPSIRATAIDYKAVAVEFGKLLSLKFWKPSYDDDYITSVNEGVVELRASIVNFVASPCGSRTYIYLAGYSQGAEVIDDLLQTLSPRLKARVDGVVLFGDPRFNAKQAAGVDQGSFSPTLSGIAPLQFKVYRPRVGVFGTLVGYYRSEAPLVHSYCAGHDPVCNQSKNTLTACADVSHFRLSSSCPHLHYADLTVAQKKSYPEAAAEFLLGRWRARTAPPPTATLSESGGRRPTTRRPTLKRYGQGPVRTARGRLPDGRNLKRAACEPHARVRGLLFKRAHSPAGGAGAQGRRCHRPWSPDRQLGKRRGPRLSGRQRRSGTQTVSVPRGDRQARRTGPNLVHPRPSRRQGQRDRPPDTPVLRLRAVRQRPCSENAGPLTPPRARAERSTPESVICSANSHKCAVSLM
jgi:hypothetical protein